MRNLLLLTFAGLGDGRGFYCCGLESLGRGRWDEGGHTPR